MPLWNTDPDTHRSVRNPAFFGPVTLATALLLVSLLSDPLWAQFHWIEAYAANTTMQVGGWGNCVRLRNTTGVIGPTKWCSGSHAGFDLNINMNDTVFYNFPTTNDDAIQLGQTPQADTTQVIPILTSGQTSVQYLHLIAALISLITALSLVVPPRWINGGKGGLANFQRSGILTLVLSAISFIMAIVAFAVIFTTVQSGKNALNAIDGIDAKWGNAQWFVLPCAILFIPPFLVTLMPSYVPKPDPEDEINQQQSQPLHPMFAPGAPPASMHGKNDSYTSLPGTPNSMHKGQFP